jgi:Snf2-ATP coupling, chromatin remodelling complex/Domain of Unknown Function (DUF1087)
MKPEDPNKFIEEFGQGKRQRKQVNYNDELPESQWLKIFEQGGDPSEEVDRLKKRRAEAKADEGESTKRRKLDHYLEDDEEPSDEI